MCTCVCGVDISLLCILIQSLPTFGANYLVWMDGMYFTILTLEGTRPIMSVIVLDFV